MGHRMPDKMLAAGENALRDSMIFDLSAKVAVARRSSRGIGKAIAQAMADAGAHVVIYSRKQVAEEINACHGAARASAVAASISVKDDLKALIQRTIDTFGRLDILVCNAASNPYYGPMRGISDEQFRKILDNNPESRARYEEATPLGRIGEPHEIARCAVFLAAPAGSYVTGNAFVIDGGLTVDGH